MAVSKHPGLANAQVRPPGLHTYFVFRRDILKCRAGDISGMGYGRDMDVDVFLQGPARGDMYTDIYTFHRLLRQQLFPAIKSFQTLEM